MRQSFSCSSSFYSSSSSSSSSFFSSSATTSLPRILIVNPNESVDFTDRIRVAARAAAGPAGATVECLQPPRGSSCASIESVYEELVSAVPTLELMKAREASFDAMVVACFSDHPAIHAGRECLKVPVVGLLDASFLTALPLGDRVSIVSTTATWGPLLRRGVASLLGCASSSRLASVRTINLPVLALEGAGEQGGRSDEAHGGSGNGRGGARRSESSGRGSDGGGGGRDEAIERICAEAVLAAEEDNAEVVVLGCAGLADLRPRVEAALRGRMISHHRGGGGAVAVVEPIAAAVEMAASLARQRLFTAKGGLYSMPKGVLVL